MRRITAQLDELSFEYIYIYIYISINMPMTSRLNGTSNPHKDVLVGEAMVSYLWGV
jgi:hypothetical protein